MDPEKEITPSPEELQEEQETLAEVQDDKLRTQVVASLGLEDNDANKALIDKIVADKKESRSKLSKAIGQKIKLRDALKTAKPAPTTPEKKDTPSLDPEAIRKQTEDTVRAQLEQRDLDELDYPDDIKAEIKKIVQLKGVSVRKAAQDGYIQHLVAEAVAAKRIDEAAISRTPKTTPAPKKDGQAPKFDMSTPDGRKAFHEWSASKRQK